MDRRAFLRASAWLPLAAPLAGCATQDLVGKTNSVRVAVSWSASELAMFRRVLERVRPHQRGAYAIDVIPLGDNIGAALNASDATVPDLVMLPEPGQVQTYAEAGKLRPFEPSLWGTDDERYASRW